LVSTLPSMFRVGGIQESVAEPVAPCCGDDGSRGPVAAGDTRMLKAGSTVFEYPSYAVITMLE
jgi:hypothetical protein